MLKSLKNYAPSGKNGFTLVEIIVSMVIVMIIVLSVMSAVTFSLKFNTLEKAKTLAQDVARNVMSQQVRTVKFETLIAKYISTDCKALHTCSDAAETVGPKCVDINNCPAYVAAGPWGAGKSITLYSKTDKVNNLTTSSLADDLSNLNKAKCVMNIKILSATQMDVKIRVLWDLNADGTEGTGTRTLELSTLVSNGDLNLKRSDVLAIPSIAPDKTIVCDPACAVGYYCSGGTCLVNPPLTCTCPVGSTTCTTGVNGNCPLGSSCDTTNGVCVALPGSCSTSSDCPANNVCVSGFCTLATCSSDSDCTTGNVCISGVCKVGCTALTCMTGYTWDPDLCKCTENLNCSTTTPIINCAYPKFCVSGICTTPCTSTSCPAGTTCNSSTRICDPISYTCSPACTSAQTCLPGTPATCVNSCTLNFNRPKNCACTLSSQCKSLNCRSSSKRCE